MKDVTRVADKPFRSAFCAALCLRGFGNASATLIDRGNGLIHDNALSRQGNANLAATNSFRVSGAIAASGCRDWATPQSWIAMNTADNLGYSAMPIPHNPI